jgi:steroid 5-alpha reductase family enzyme
VAAKSSSVPPTKHILLMVLHSESVKLSLQMAQRNRSKRQNDSRFAAMFFADG